MTEPTDIVISPATDADLAGIVAILNHTAASSTASFDTRPVDVDERREWFDRFAPTGPYRCLVARHGGRVAGYACSRPYRTHEAFRQTVEVSVALDPDSRRRGVGTALYRTLFAALDDEPVHVALAGIAMPNDASVALHRKFGFTEVGVFRDYAVKNGRYLSSLWLQRISPATGPR